MMPMAAPTGSRPAAKGGFSVSKSGSSEKAAAAAKAASASGVVSVDALMALQGEADLGERRRRAVKRANHMLDALDELKLAVLEGRISPSVMANLSGLSKEQRDAMDDPRLEGLLRDIETRAAVELAKWSKNQTPRVS